MRGTEIFVVRNASGEGTVTRIATVFLLMFLLLSVSPRKTFAFDYFEHRFLGNIAYRNALGKTHNPAFVSTIQDATERQLGFGVVQDKPKDLFGRVLERLPIEFGDLTALAGDLTADVEDLKGVLRDIAGRRTDDTDHLVYNFMTGERAAALIRQTRRQWESVCKWAYQKGWSKDRLGLSDCFASIADRATFAASPTNRFGSDGYRPSREELAGYEAIPKYVSLASVNRDHFPRYSWRAYARFHLRALELAQCFRGKKECADVEAGVLSGDELIPRWEASPNSEFREEERRIDYTAYVLTGDGLLIQALLNEAFAQHYLQDSFASGHIGSVYGNCVIEGLGIGCIPTKTRTQQTHDVLNEIGLRVKIEKPPADLQTLGEKLHNGWDAFGDRNLFIPEADFHRAVILHFVTESIKEVFEVATGVREQSRCGMCDVYLFPIPEARAYLSEDWDKVRGVPATTNDYPLGSLARFERLDALFSLEARSLDPRVPGIPVEGWKVGLGFVQRRFKSESASDGGLLARLDYIRNVDPATPNSWGFEYWSVANRGQSYLLSVAYLRPRELSPLSFTLGAKLGWRIEENLTPSNPTTERRNVGEIIFPSFEVTYEIYKPFALFYQTNYQLRDIENIRHPQVKKSVYTGGAAVGVRMDLSGI